MSLDGGAGSRGKMQDVGLGGCGQKPWKALRAYEITESSKCNSQTLLTFTAGSYCKAGPREVL